MHIWVLEHGEQLPLNSKSRVYRMGMIANKFAEKNNKVMWWTSNFNHALKFPENIKSIENNSIEFIFLKGIPYSKNISIKRIINHQQIGNKLQKEMTLVNEKPDIIITSMPTIDFAYKAVKYAKSNNIPVIVDIRDLWPDVFKELIPISLFKKDIFFRPFNKKLKWILKYSTGVTAITDEYLSWALKKADLELDSEKHKVFPIGYPSVTINSEENPFDKSCFNILFIGTIGVHFDLETILDVAQKTENQNIKYYIIGDGDKREILEKAYPISNVVFTGWLDGEMLNRYLSHGDVGIAPYRNTENFLLNIPNKFYEYMAHAIPIITCLPGPSEELVVKNGLGLTYKEGNRDELYQRIMQLRNNKKLREKMSENALSTFNNNFSTDIIYDKYYKFVKGIIERY